MVDLPGKEVLSVDPDACQAPAIAEAEGPVQLSMLISVDEFTSTYSSYPEEDIVPLYNVRRVLGDRVCSV